MSRPIEPEIRSRACDACGEPLDGPGITVLELPYRAVEQLRDYYPNLMEQLDRGDGKLVYHNECGHPIEDLLPSEDEMARYSAEEARENMMECPVCEVTAIAARDECGRCGAELEATA